jgi:hypothetical protein
VPFFAFYFHVVRNRHSLKVHPDAVTKVPDDLQKRVKHLSSRSLPLISDTEIYYLRNEPSRDLDSNRISISDAIFLASSPLKVMVENARYDRAFLLAAGRDEQLRRIRNAIADNQLEFLNGGGIGEMRKRLEFWGTLPNFELLRHRLFVLFDRDASEPGDHSKNSGLLKEFCEEKEIRHWCLQRRAIENYLPKESLGAIKAKKARSRDRRGERQYLDGLLNILSEKQRWFIHMEKGLPATDLNPLFIELDGSDRRVLSCGVPKDWLSDVFLEKPPGMWQAEWVNKDHSQFAEREEIIQAILSKY